MRSIVAMSIAAALLVACGQGNQPGQATTEQPAVVQGEPESVAPAAATVPPAVAAGQPLLPGLDAGGSATVRLDACPNGFNAAERLGSIMCGRDYTVYYEASTQRWVGIGPNASLVADGAADPNAGAKIPGSPPNQNVIVLWGLSLIVDPETNNVALGDGTPVGHLVHTGA